MCPSAFELSSGYFVYPNRWTQGFRKVLVVADDGAAQTRGVRARGGGIVLIAFVIGTALLKYFFSP